MSSHPVRRRRAGRRRSRKTQTSGLEIFLVLFVAAVVLAMVTAAVTWLLEHWWLLVVLAVLAVATFAGWAYRQAQKARWEQIHAQGLRFQLSQLDSLHYDDFEHAVRNLMHRDGCRNAVKVGKGGDNGADVKATDPLGRLWVIQCKHRRKGLQGSPVGTPDLHVLNGTARQLHGADVVVMVTNGRYTTRCAPLAKSQKLHLVDRKMLGEWAGGSRPLWELLRAVPPPRKPTRLT